MRDTQDVLPLRFCSRCCGEIYGGDAELCESCQEEIRSDDTLLLYAKSWPDRLNAFLKDNVSEDFIKPFWAAFREYSEGDGADGPDYERWARS
jgi:hypothetical protein